MLSGDPLLGAQCQFNGRCCTECSFSGEPLLSVLSFLESRQTRASADLAGNRYQNLFCLAGIR